jgi:hypothetical protein
MKSIQDPPLVTSLARCQRGVFSKADLQSALGEPHPAAFTRRIRSLMELGVLRRFVRGWYVTEGFDLPTLSQRLAPRSYVSFGNALARHLLVGTAPERQVMAAKVGPARSYRGAGVEVVHVAIAPHLDFGHETVDGVAWADPERAVLDVLSSHQRGRRFVFDVYSDIAYHKLDRHKLAEYLGRYRNPRFIAFVRGVLEGS